MVTITGGELVVRTLLAAKVRHVFGLHGAHLETIFQSLASHGVPIIDTRHEVAAGHAAEGYARASRGLGVAMVTAGPGFTNVITSLANAYLDRTPVLYLSGSAALRDAESNTLQAGIDQVAIARPVTKWAHQITTPCRFRGWWPRRSGLLLLRRRARCCSICRWTCSPPKSTRTPRPRAPMSCSIRPRHRRQRRSTRRWSCC